jgi:protein-S-isoprenylcysteine O-methyltransferase Ste14
MQPLIFTNHAALWILTAAYVIWLVPELIYAFTHRVDARSMTGDRLSGAVLRISIWVGILLGYWLAHTQPWADISWHPVFLFALGVVLMVIGVAFRWYAVRVLGRYFSLQLAVHSGQTVVQEGPYRWIRHPSYTGALITMFGLGLVFTNWLSFISILAAGCIGFGYRVLVEERMLLAALVDPYREYMKHTKRFIPFVY